jgi:hypothetical protein
MVTVPPSAAIAARKAGAFTPASQERAAAAALKPRLRDHQFAPDAARHESAIDPRLAQQRHHIGADLAVGGKFGAGLFQLGQRHDFPFPWRLRRAILALPKRRAALCATRKQSPRSEKWKAQRAFVCLGAAFAPPRAKAQKLADWRNKDTRLRLRPMAAARGAP